jgi:hypothetical protein
MTLVLTCLTSEYIVQASDRRLTLPDGRLYDDDTNKAVFYCGRVAVAYTGLAYIDGRETAEWIGNCMKDAEHAELAMNEVARRAQSVLGGGSSPARHFAAVAAGWATLRGEAPLRPYVCTASNFMNDAGEWEDHASDRVRLRTEFLGEPNSHLFHVAGQNLTRAEVARVARLIRKAIERRSASPRPLARVLGGTVREVANGNDARAARVGKGMIIQALSREALLTSSSMIVTPLTPRCHSFVYVSKDGRTDPFQGAVMACGGALLTGFGGGTIPPGAKGQIRTEMEEAARGSPLRVAQGETHYSAPCPFCASPARSKQVVQRQRMVGGELPESESETWVYCQGDRGHLLLVKRSAVPPGHS